MKFRKEPQASRKAGAAKSHGFALFLTCKAAAVGLVCNLKTSTSKRIASPMNMSKFMNSECLNLVAAMRTDPASLESE